jgi:poly(hydroxyalkanoate) granule-associated protein
MTTETKTEAAVDAKTPVDADVARKIWLAGVGAYGRMFAGAQEQFEKVAETANGMFDELVKRGEAVEDDVRAMIAKNQPIAKATEQVSDVAKRAGEIAEERRAKLTARIDTVRKSVGDTLAPFNIVALHHSVEELEARVDMLMAEVEALKGKKAAPKAKAAETAEA